jgi:hypothetical protein
MAILHKQDLRDFFKDIGARYSETTVGTQFGYDPCGRASFTLDGATLYADFTRYKDRGLVDEAVIGTFYKGTADPLKAAQLKEAVSAKYAAEIDAIRCIRVPQKDGKVFAGIYGKRLSELQPTLVIPVAGRWEIARFEVQGVSEWGDRILFRRHVLVRDGEVYAFPTLKP